MTYPPADPGVGDQAFYDADDGVYGMGRGGSLSAGMPPVLLGVALDIVRYRTVPELRMSEEELADRMEHVIADPVLVAAFLRP